MLHFIKKSGNWKMPVEGRCVSNILSLGIFALRDIYFTHDKISNALRNED